MPLRRIEAFLVHDCACLCDVRDDCCRRVVVGILRRYAAQNDMISCSLYNSDLILAQPPCDNSYIIPAWGRETINPPIRRKVDLYPWYSSKGPSQELFLLPVPIFFRGGKRGLSLCNSSMRPTSKTSLSCTASSTALIFQTFLL